MQSVGTGADQQRILMFSYQQGSLEQVNRFCVALQHLSVGLQSLDPSAATLLNVKFACSATPKTLLPRSTHTLLQLQAPVESQAHCSGLNVPRDNACTSRH